MQHKTMNGDAHTHVPKNGRAYHYLGVRLVQLEVVFQACPWMLDSQPSAGRTVASNTALGTPRLILCLPLNSQVVPCLTSSCFPQTRLASQGAHAKGPYFATDNASIVVELNDELSFFNLPMPLAQHGFVSGRGLSGCGFDCQAATGLIACCVPTACMPTACLPTACVPACLPHRCTPRKDQPSAAAISMWCPTCRSAVVQHRWVG